MRIRRKAFTGGGFQFSETLTDRADYNVSTAAIAAGWDGSSPIVVNITVPSGVIIRGTPSGQAYSFILPSLPSGSLVNLIVDGLIIGYGGVNGLNGGNGSNGKNACSFAYPVNITGSGQIAGGGGGGGGGAAIDMTGPNGAYSSPGGPGGWGAGYQAPYDQAVSGSPGPIVSGGQTYYAQGGTGGSGGAPGMPGSGGGYGTGIGTVVAQGTPGAGGAAGVAINGMQFVIFPGNVINIAGSVVYGSNEYIPTPTATPSVGSVFEGGYYAGGLVWAQAAQSDTQLTIGPSKAITLKTTQSGPFFYANQGIEIRSRANPANNMVGTVIGSANGNVTINVSTASGSGNVASDWSIMAKYRLILAPKASGETTLSISNGTIPAACWTLIDGYSSTRAMVSSGDSTQYPAPYWATGLNIGGYTDWYIPARDELERIWRLLKPLIVSNYTTADRPTGATSSYENNGAKGDVSASQGVNNNAQSGTVSAYTTTSPGQTSPAVFRTGGAQVMEYGTAVYGSSTGYDSSNLWVQSYQTATPGKQTIQAKGTPTLIRAIRRSIF